MNWKWMQLKTILFMLFLIVEIGKACSKPFVSFGSQKHQTNCVHTLWWHQSIQISWKSDETE